MPKSYSPSLLKGKDEKVSTPQEADRMLINLEDMKKDLSLESDEQCHEIVRSQMKRFGFKGELRTSDSKEYLIAFKTSRFAFEV